MLKISDVISMAEPPQIESFCDEFAQESECFEVCPFGKLCRSNDIFHYFIQDYAINRDTTIEELVRQFLEWNGFPQSIIDLVTVMG